jgi:hypothetical protein
MASTKPQQKHPHTEWRVWSAAKALEARKDEFYPDTTSKVIEILNYWGETWGGDDNWVSLLNKKSLLHECEESIVAIHHILRNAPDTEYIAADICAGKGLFSILLSYINPPQLVKIVMLEKAAINWHHIEAANAARDSDGRGRPEIEIWGNTNLHEYDQVLDRFMKLGYPLAMTGIHLCKQLSPSFCGLVNGLGESVNYACLAPCCLPRIVTAQKYNKEGNNDKESVDLTINIFETPEERQKRLSYTERRENVLSRKRPYLTGGPCFLCKAPDHNLLDCPQVKQTKSKTEMIYLRKQEHAATVPCWKCGELVSEISIRDSDDCSTQPESAHRY